MIPFPVLLAWREARSGLRRVGLYGAAIGLGVAALVSVHSFRDDVARSIRLEARTLMGADIQLQASRPLPDSVADVVDSLAAAGHRNARVVTAVSMVAAAGSDAVRLLQVRGVEGAWPFYGAVTTRPADAWRQRDGATALVDAAVLPQLDVVVGDTLLVGGTPFAIAGVVDDLPTDLAFQTAIGPRVWLTGGGLDRTGILGFGSLARYETFVELPDPDDQREVRERYRSVLGSTGVDLTTADQRARALTRGVEILGRFLGLVGLGALLLGGLGVGSAVHVFVRERLTQVAVLRCVGARQNGVFAAYLLQAAALGLAGAALGAAMGVAIQHGLPLLLTGVLPVEVTPRISWAAVGAGMATGLWVATLFALLPLLAVRDVPPLRALRRDVEAEPARGRRARAAVVAALAASVLGLAVLEAPTRVAGLAFAAALAVAVGLLWMAGRGTVALARRLFPQGAPYPLRQGFSNLFRPRNQTVGVVLALGFGVFVVTTLVQVRLSVGRELTLDVEANRPNLLLFDIQPDQLEGVLDLLPEGAREGAEATPLVPSRLVAVNGRAPAELRDLPAGERPEAWALRREYRHTWRDTLTDAEILIEGAWWPDAPAAPRDLARVSLEESLAADLGVGLGDTLTWSVGGLELDTRITSLRRVDWERFQTNFFVVFEPGGLDGAPATFVVLARLDGDEARGRFQRRLVEPYPNVSALDVSRIQEAVEGILEQVARAHQILALFVAVAGVLVLAGALATSRHQRLREGALLRTLGARRGQLLSVLFSEFVALGTLATAVGMALGVAAAALVVKGLFQVPFRPEPAWLAGTWGAVLLLTVATGLAGSRGLLRRPPLPMLRDLVD